MIKPERTQKSASMNPKRSEKPHTSFMGSSQASYISALLELWVMRLSAIR